TKWYEEHGRHEIFAGGKKVKMEEEHVDYLRLREALVTNELQHDLDNLGIAKNAREEKVRARDAKQKATAAGNSPLLAKDARNGAPEPDGVDRGPKVNDEAYNARMAALYREVVLKEKPVVAENGFIPLGALTGNGNGTQAAKPEIAEPVAGD
ncbi:MAG: hypothetical protein WAO10_17995, partial [Candidatus Sulfotelmatobacter sp.]